MSPGICIYLPLCSQIFLFIHLSTNTFLYVMVTNYVISYRVHGRSVALHHHYTINVCEFSIIQKIVKKNLAAPPWWWNALIKKYLCIRSLITMQDYQTFALEEANEDRIHSNANHLLTFFMLTNKWCFLSSYELQQCQSIAYIIHSCEQVVSFQAVFSTDSDLDDIKRLFQLCNFMGEIESAYEKSWWKKSNAENMEHLMT